MEKRIKEEADALLHLELQRIQAEATSMDRERFLSDIWIFHRYLQKLEAASNKHERAISDLIVSDINLKMAYTSKLTQQQRLTDPILAQLQTRIPTIYKMEVKEELKGEKVKEAVETELTPELRPSFLPNEQQHVPYVSATQTTHYIREKITEKIEVTYLTSRESES